MTLRCPECDTPLCYVVYYTATVHAAVSYTGQPGPVTRNVIDAVKVDQLNWTYSDLDIDYILCSNCKTHIEQYFNPALEKFDGANLTVQLTDEFVMENYL